MRESDPDRPRGLFSRGFWLWLWNRADWFAGRSRESSTFSILCLSRPGDGRTDKLVYMI